MNGITVALRHNVMKDFVSLSNRVMKYCSQLAEGIMVDLEETSGYVRQERVNRWPNSTEDIINNNNNNNNNNKKKKKKKGL